MKISSSALAAVESTRATDPSSKASHARLHLQPKSASLPGKESDDHNGDSRFYANGTEDSDDGSSINALAVMQMRVPSDAVEDVDVVAQRDDYHCIQSAHASGYDIEKYFLSTSFLCGVENREWCSTECADYPKCDKVDDWSVDAAYNFATSATSTTRKTPRPMKIDEIDTGTTNDENRNVPRYTPYVKTQFEAICATGERPFQFVALRSIKALNRSAVIPITIDKPGPLGLIVKDNSDGVVCVVDVSPRAMEACKVLHPGDILAHLENDEKEIIPQIEVVIKNTDYAANVPIVPSSKKRNLNPPLKGKSLYDKLEVRATTGMTLPNTETSSFLTGILAIFEQINSGFANLLICSMAPFGFSSLIYKPTCADKPIESLDDIPCIEPINPDALLESTSSLQNPDEAQERLGETQEEPTEDQSQKPKIIASRVISSDDNLPSSDDEYFNGMFSSDGSYISIEGQDLNATNGIIPLLKRTGPERLADNLAEDIVSSIEAANIDAILDTVVEHLDFIFDSVIPDGEDDDDGDEEDDDSELLESPTNAKDDRDLDRNAPPKLKALVNGKHSSVTKDRRGTKFLRKIRRYRLLLHKRLNRSTIPCSGVHHKLGADSFGGESSDSDSDSSDFALTEKGPGLNLSMPEFGRYAEQGVDRLQKLQKAVGTLQLQDKLGQAMEGMASSVKTGFDPIKPAQTSSEELARAWRSGCERALQQMNEEETAYLTAYTAATGTSALTAVSELALLSTIVNKNASRTYNINNSTGAMDTVAGNICDGDGGIGVLASKYITRAQKDKEKAARMEAMTRALAVERKNRAAGKSSKNKKGRVRFEGASDVVSSAGGASSKYSASVSKGIKKSSRARKNHKGTVV